MWVFGVELCDCDVLWKGSVGGDVFDVEYCVVEIWVECGILVGVGDENCDELCGVVW